MRAVRALFAVSLFAALAGGALAQDLPARCTDLSRADRGGHFVAMADLARPMSALDGDALLALVDRSPEGALPPDYAPTDLVDLETMRASRASRCTPPSRQCLRRDAALAYRRLARAMRQAGHAPHPSSAFRAYRVQCSTFGRWSRRGGFCEATSVSALPGHSQHQLGTTLDLFTYAWASGGDKFRPGYGCSPGGRWIAEHAHEFGFVLTYPLHHDFRARGSTCSAIEGDETPIDPRTGYRYEPWHIRFIGADAVARFRAAWRASGPGTASEITLDQWLRAQRGAPSRVGAPVCDGCNCDRCATFAERGPCETPAWTLTADGRRQAASRPPRVLGASVSRDGETVWLEVRLDVAPNTATQGPILTSASGARYRRGSREVELPGGVRRAFPSLPGAYRVVIGFGERGGWPWSAGLVAGGRDGAENGFDALIPAAPGQIQLRLPLLGVSPGTSLRVGVSLDGGAADAAWRGVAP